LRTPFSETNGQFSPDRKWMAYAADESGQSEIYVQGIPAGGARVQVSVMGGTSPHWRRDGKELFYVSADQRLMAVPVRAGTTIEAGAPQALFDLNNPERLTGFQPSPDGQRFLVNVQVEGAGTRPITVLLHWQSELKK
jgi:Tol biopolymer transport system component